MDPANRVSDFSRVAMGEDSERLQRGSIHEEVSMDPVHSVLHCHLEVQRVVHGHHATAGAAGWPEVLARADGRLDYGGANALDHVHETGLRRELCPDDPTADVDRLATGESQRRQERSRTSARN